MCNILREGFNGEEKLSIEKSVDFLSEELGKLFPQNDFEFAEVEDEYGEYLEITIISERDYNDSFLYALERRVESALKQIDVYTYLPYEIVPVIA